MRIEDFKLRNGYSPPLPLRTESLEAQTGKKPPKPGLPLSLCLLLVLCSCGRREAVSLDIVDAFAKQERDYLDAGCTAVLENRTGSSLVVTSAFYSAFDGLRLIVTSEQGTRLAEQPYAFHQSPYTFPGRPFIVQPGVTTQRMRIPVFSLTNAPAKVKFQLVGPLRDSSYTGALTSRVVTVWVQSGK